MEEQDMMEFTPESLKEFKEKYKRAVEADDEVFTFEGREVYVGYAKYVIELLEQKFKL